MIRVTEAFSTAFKDVKIIREVCDKAEEIIVSPKDKKVWFIFDTKDLPDENKFNVMAKLIKNMKLVRDFFKVYGLKKFDIEFAIIEKGEIGNEVPTTELRRVNKQIKDLNRIYDDVNAYINSIKEFTRKVNTLTDSISKTGYNGVELTLSMNLYAKPERKDDYDLNPELYNLLLSAYRELYGDYVRDYSLYKALDGRAIRVLKSVIEAKYPVNWDNVPGDTMKDKVINFIRERNLESVFFPVLKELLKDKTVLEGVEPLEDKPKTKVKATPMVETPVEETEPRTEAKQRSCNELTEEEQKAVAEAIRSGKTKKEILAEFNITARCYQTIREKMKEGVL